MCIVILYVHYPDLKPGNETKLKRGESNILYHGSATAVRWFDKRDVLMLSTIFKNEENPIDCVSRHSVLSVLCPMIAQDYNTFMGGVAVVDQHMVHVYYSCGRKKYEILEAHHLVFVGSNYFEFSHSSQSITTGNKWANYVTKNVPYRVGICVNCPFTIFEISSRTLSYDSKFTQTERKAAQKAMCCLFQKENPYWKSKTLKLVTIVKNVRFIYV